MKPATTSVPQPRRIPRKRRGLSLLEAMISLVISTILLVAVSAAFQASAKAVELNDSYFRCSQAGRVTMIQMLTEMRRADAVQVDSGGTWVQVIRPMDQLTPNEIYRQFTYDAANQRITLQIFYTGSTSSAVYELAANVNACSFGPADMGTDYNNSLVAVRIPVTITCTSGGNSVTLSGAAAPRRSQQF
ncbi:MAG TPA: prepilin-type N-terminal cleavage/methylation domain-containing protein [Tepidisphaeraceae bacterium]|nr:prepilin-type N-terminal cleavage/methylation domain-containing protein [Tepidisphaeraceae bacterium]